MMRNQAQEIFPQEVFDALFVEAVGDLRKSGFKEEEVFSIIENQFGSLYAHRFCSNETFEGDAENAASGKTQAARQKKING